MTIKDQRRVLLLLSSSSYRAEDFLSAARRLNVDVTVGSDYRNALADEAFGSTLELDFDDVEGSIDAIRRIAEDQSLSAVVAAEDAGTRLAAAVSVFGSYGMAIQFGRKCARPLLEFASHR